MKKFLVLSAVGLLGSMALVQAQHPEPLVDRDSIAIATPSEPSIPEVPEVPEIPALKDDSSHHEVMGDSPEINKSGDTTRIRLGKKGIVIVEKDGKTTVQIDKNEDDSYYGDHREKDDQDFDKDNKDSDDWNFKKHKPAKFRPHFAGLELNLNNFLTSNNSLNLPKEMQFMELNTSKSIGVRLNFMEFGIPITHEQGFVTGLGLEFNSYYFASDSNNITKDKGQIVAKMKPGGAGPYDKNKLKDTYLNIPLFYEIQFPLGNAKKPLYFSFGVIGGIKIGSSTKEYYNLVNEGEKKIKTKDDFYLSPFRYGFQAKIGYRMIHLVGTYFASPLFQDGKGPELHPFDIGLVVLNF